MKAHLMKSKIFKLAVASDIHLGHARNKTEEIIKNLNIAFDDNEAFHELDMLILAGDIFDSYLSSLEMLQIAVWQRRLILLCKKHDVSLRILKGTPSHDWDQSVSFEYVNEKIAHLEADVKYIKDLSICYEEKFDLNFLFVPDEWSESTDETLRQVKELLKAKGLEKVDYAVMHGNFVYQIPSFVKAPKHSEEEYLNLTKELIFIGHVHTASQYDRIYAQGSFDRLSHGQEEAKGYLRDYRYEDGHHEVTFIENKGAKLFKTIRLEEESLEDSFQKIESVVENLPEESFIRIKALDSHPILASLETLIQRYPIFHWSKEAIDTRKDIKEQKEELQFKAIDITRENIKSLLQKRIENLKVDSLVFNRSLFYIDEMLDR